jgi:hypothetical protein
MPTITTIMPLRPNLVFDTFISNSFVGLCAMSGMLLLFDINLIEVTAFNFLDGTLGEKRNLLALYSASFSFVLSFCG